MPANRSSRFNPVTGPRTSKTASLTMSLVGLTVSFDGTLRRLLRLAPPTIRDGALVAHPSYSLHPSHLGGKTIDCSLHQQCVDLRGMFTRPPDYIYRFGPSLLEKMPIPYQRGHL